MNEADQKGVDLDQLDYFDYALKGEKIEAYIRLIKESKSSVSIPVVASVNFVCSQEWIYYSKQLEAAGAERSLNKKEHSQLRES